MTAHPIAFGARGLRYITGDDFDDELQVFVTEGLRGLDFDQTVEWYFKTDPDLTDRQRAYLACNDRYYLLTHLLERGDMFHPWIFDRCREVEASPDKHIDLWSRYHYKSSIITYGGVIQEVLIDPEITIGIFSQTLPMAQKFLDAIKDTLETNGVLKRIFADVLWQDPKNHAPRWSVARGLVVKRSSKMKEPTIGAYGLLNTMPTGSHFRLRLYDDLVDLKTVTNEEMIKKTTIAYEMSQNLGVESGSREQMAGTRYSFADTYGVIMERDNATPRIYPATDNGKLDGIPVLLSPKAWAEAKSKQRSTVAAQMLLNPLMGSENTFDVRWFKAWEVRPSVLNVYIMCDPSRGRTKTSDRTAIAVIGVDVGGNKYLLDGYRHRMKLSQRYDALKQLHKKWTAETGVQVVVMGYERFGQQADDEVFEEYMARDKYWFAMEELAWPREGGQSKKHRVERLEPDFKNGRFYLPAIIHNANKGGDCLWRVGDDDKNEPAEILYTPVPVLQLVDERSRISRLPTKLMQAAHDAGQPWRVARPIKRLDEDGKVYDVSKALMDEMLLFPFAPKDDLVDATSRIYDIQATKPRWVADDDEKIYADI